MTNISVPSELAKAGKDAGLNLSAVCRNAIAEGIAKMKSKDFGINQLEKAKVNK